jgi:hypothetical protein
VQVTGPGDVTPAGLAALSDDELAAVTHPERVRRLVLEGPAVTSLDAIERFRALRQLALHGTGDTDLSALERLPRLERLIIDCPQIRDAPDLGWRAPVTEPLDYAPLTRLHGVKELYVRVIDFENAAALACIPLGDLRDLEVLHHCHTPEEMSLRGPASDLSARPQDGFPLVDYRWLEDLPALREFTSSGFRPVGDGGATILAEARRTARFGLPFPMPWSRQVSGKRADLRSMKDPAMITSLSLTGRGLASLEGIEAMHGLVTIMGERLARFDAAGILGLKHLQSLYIQADTIDNLGALADAAGLRTLSLEIDDDHTAAELSGLDLGRLQRLVYLGLFVLAPTVRPVLDIDALTRIPGLADLTVAGMRAPLGDLEALDRMPALRSLAWPFPDGPSYVAMRARHPEWHVGDTSQMRPRRGPAIVAVPVDDGGAAFMLELDGTEIFDTDTNYDAERRLRALIKGRDSSLSRRLRYDTEAEHVVVLADKREDLEAVLRIATP